MAHLSIIGCHAVNGVAAIHSQILKDTTSVYSNSSSSSSIVVIIINNNNNNNNSDSAYVTVIC